LILLEMPTRDSPNSMAAYINLKEIMMQTKTTNTKKKVKQPANTAKLKPKPKPKTINSKPTKANMILTLLRRAKGASLVELCEATGWQAHSVRGFLSGTIKKRLGLELSSKLDGKGQRRYLLPNEAETSS